MNWEDKKVICFTGKLDNLTRNEAFAMTENAGFAIAITVSKETDYLVIADPNSQSTKARKARSLGIKLISEDEFIELCKLDKQQVEAEAEYKRTHKEKEVLDWALCCKRLCKKLGLTYKSESVVGSDYKTRHYRAMFYMKRKDLHTEIIGDSDSYLWQHNKEKYSKWYDHYATTRDEAFKALILQLFKHESLEFNYYTTESKEQIKHIYSALPPYNGF